MSWGDLYQRKTELKAFLESLFKSAEDYSDSWGELYDYHAEYHGDDLETFHNTCHDATGRFCEGPDGPGRVRENKLKKGRDPETGVPVKRAGGGKTGPGSRSAGERKKEKSGYHPAGDYAYVPAGSEDKSSEWKLRLTDKPGGKPSAKITSAAAQALSPGGFRGRQVQIPAKDRPAVVAKVRAAWLVAHPGKTAADLPASLVQK